jgi:hypothetical protein
MPISWDSLAVSPLFATAETSGSLATWLSELASMATAIGVAIALLQLRREYGWRRAELTFRIIETWDEEIAPYRVLIENHLGTPVHRGDMAPTHFIDEARQTGQRFGLLLDTDHKTAYQLKRAIIHTMNFMENVGYLSFTSWQWWTSRLDKEMLERLMKGSMTRMYRFLYPYRLERSQCLLNRPDCLKADAWDQLATLMIEWGAGDPPVDCTCKLCVQESLCGESKPCSGS